MSYGSFSFSGHSTTIATATTMPSLTRLLPNSTRLRAETSIFSPSQGDTLLSFGVMFSLENTRRCWIEIDRHAARHDIVSDPDQVIGQQVRRTMQAERPVRLSDMQRPVLIAKNDLVTMTVASGNMTLVMTGVAQEDGAAGDSVRLLNPKSQKTVQGVVTGPMEICIPTGTPLQVTRY